MKKWKLQRACEVSRTLMHYVRRVLVWKDWKISQKLNKRVPDAACIRNKAATAPTRILAWRDNCPKKWWMLLPAHALPILYSPAYWLEFVKCHLGPCLGGQHPKNREQHQTRSLVPSGQTFMSLFTDLLSYRPVFGNHWNKCSFLTWSFPNLKVQDSTISYQQKQKKKKNPNNLRFGHKHDLMI